VHIEKLTTLII